MTSYDGEEQLDGLSPRSLIHLVKNKSYFRKRLFEASHYVREDLSDTPEERKDLNVIDTSEEQIHHANKNVSDVRTKERLFQASLYIRKYSTNPTSDEQKDSKKINTLSKQIHSADEKKSETYLLKRLFKSPHCAREECSDTAQKQKNPDGINAPSEKICHSTRRSSESCFGKRLSQIPHCIREDFFDTSEEQKNSNEIGASAEQVHHAARKPSETSLGERLFQAPHYIREDCFDTSEGKEYSTEIDTPAEQADHAARTSETYFGEQLFQAPQCMGEHYFYSCLEQKKSNEIDPRAGQVHHAARRASKTYLGKQLFHVAPCVIEEFSDICKEKEHLKSISVPEEYIHLADKNATETSDKRSFPTSCVSENFPDNLQKRKDSNEVNVFAKQINHATIKTPKTYLRKRLLQPPFRPKDFSNNSEEQEVSKEIDASVEHLADRSALEAFLGEKLFHTPHCAEGDFSDSEKQKYSNEFDMSAEQVNCASGRTLETFIDKMLFQVPHCVRGDSSDVSDDENYSNEIEAIAEQVRFEAMRDQKTYLCKSFSRDPQFFRDKFSEISKEINNTSEMNTHAEQIHQAAGSYQESSENNEERTKESWGGTWKTCHFRNLPRWLQDNDFLHSGHRPPMESFWACFRSAFQIHTETGNIWTHLMGCALFVGITVHFLSCEHVTWRDKLVFGTFLGSVILCLGTSSVFHAVSCHSERICKLFSKLDYCGIAALITGSFVPWLHYGFYCESRLRVFYSALVATLGSTSTALSLYDRFSEPRFRQARAALFAGFGLSGVVPTAHYLISKGWVRSVGWLVLMAALYLLGAAIYASRIPERFFPGRFDIIFQSHQIFHVLVVAAALVHYHGTRELAFRTLLSEECASAID